MLRARRGRHELPLRQLRVTVVDGAAERECVDVDVSDVELLAANVELRDVITEPAPLAARQFDTPHRRANGSKKPRSVGLPAFPLASPGHFRNS